jgi:hypothetical protein
VQVFGHYDVTENLCMGGSSHICEFLNNSFAYSIVTKEGESSMSGEGYESTGPGIVKVSQIRHNGPLNQIQTMNPPEGWGTGV